MMESRRAMLSRRKEEISSVTEAIRESRASEADRGTSPTQDLRKSSDKMVDFLTISCLGR